MSPASTDPDAIRAALVRQAAAPVRWVETMRAMQAAGVTHVYECGPGKVLAGLVKRCADGLAGGAMNDLAGRGGGAGRGERMSMDECLQGQVALVTGASRGIGRAIALALGRAGRDRDRHRDIDEAAPPISRRRLDDSRHQGLGRGAQCHRWRLPARP